MANISTGRKSGFIIRGGSRKRDTLWLGGAPFQQALVAPTTVALVTSLNAAALALRPFTVVRSRGQLLCKSDQIGGSEDYAGAFGSCIVSDQANAIGVTAVPTPTTDSGSDLWFVYEFMMGAFAFGTQVAFTSVGGVIRVVDSKAMRKVEDGQDLVGVVEGGGAGSDNGSQINGFMRHLIKLH